MTKNRNLKMRIRKRMAETGESYAVARFNFLGPEQGNGQIIALQDAEESGLPPEEFWTEATRLRYFQRAKERNGEQFRQVATLEPRLKGLEERVRDIWAQLIESKPSYFRVEDHWYGSGRIKRALSKLVGWDIPTSVGLPPEVPDTYLTKDGVLNLEWGQSSEYLAWFSTNREALKKIGFLATSEAYQPCYDYLRDLLPWRYRWDAEGEESMEDFTDLQA